MIAPNPLSLFLALAFIVYAILVDRKRRARFPPGPPGLPLVGNILDLPKTRQWLAYQRWGREYGTAVVHIKLFRTHVVVLNTVKAAKDLMEKRSRLYSDKPCTVMQKLTGWVRNIGLMPYGDGWRAHRRLFNQYFHERASEKYRPQIQHWTEVILNSLLEDPDNFVKHVRFRSGALFLKIAYGLNIEDDTSPYVQSAELAVEGSNQIAQAGFFLVDLLPILQYIPSWFPGARFKRQAATWGKAVSAMYDLPWYAATEAISSGGANESIASLLLAREAKLGQSQEEVIKNVVGIAFAAGEETTTSTLSTFFLAMILNPDVQLAAREELDRVCGLDRLPDFEDKDDLPFVTAVMYETMRWHPALPLGVAHKSVSDDWYEGLFIPGGASVMHNTWAILHDEGMYPEPAKFNPRRFLDADGNLLKDVVVPEAVFGFGRRICPGRYFVLQMLWLFTARVLATLKIEKPTDGKGKVIEPSGEFSSSTICFPLPFKAAINPRSRTAAGLIRACFEKPGEEDSSRTGEDV